MLLSRRIKQSDALEKEKEGGKKRPERTNSEGMELKKRLSF